jgi:hypothetical protein
VLVLMLTTAILGPVFTERFGPRMGHEPATNANVTPMAASEPIDAALR